MAADRSTHAGVAAIFQIAWASTYISLGTLDWVELALDLTMAQAMVSNFAANDISQIGVQLDTGAPYEGGSWLPGDTVFYVDSITAQ